MKAITHAVDISQRALRSLASAGAPPVLIIAATAPRATAPAAAKANSAPVGMPGHT